MTWLWTLLLAGVLSISPSPTDVAPPRPQEADLAPGHGDPIEVSSFRLANGLTVILAESHHRSEVFGAVVVRAGAKDDPADDTGMAHYLEHMLFKGTQALGTSDYAEEAPLLAELEGLYDRLRSADGPARRAIEQRIDEVARAAARHAIPGELDRLLREMGGHGVNAFTHPDMTVYYNAFPASQVTAWLEVYAHRFERPVFRLFPSELEAVYEEKNRAMDGFFDAAYEAFTRAFFPTHTYGTQTVLGTVEHLKRPSLSAMREFYDRYYVANNMALVLVGDFEAERVRPVVERSFSSWRSAPVDRRDHGAVAPFAGRKRTTVRVTPLRAGALAFRIPVTGHPDDAATRVLLQLLSNASGSGVLDRLADSGRLLMQMVFELDFHDANGAILAYAPRLLTQTFAGAERLIQGELDALARGEVHPSSVAAARRNLVRQARQTWEEHRALALVLVDLFARGLTWRDHLAYIRRLERVDVADVQRAAQRYFGPNRLAIRSRMGSPDRRRLEKPAFTPVSPEVGARSPFYQQMQRRETPPPAPRYVDFARDVQRRELAPGVQLHTNHNPVNDIYRLELRFGVGRHAIPALQLLGDYLERAGTRRRPATAFKEAWFELATSFDAEATDEAFVLRLEGPQAHFEPALGLVAELLREPARDGTRLRRLKRELWATDRALRAQPETIADALWEHVLYGDASTYRRYGIAARRRWSTGDLLRAFARARAHEVTVRYSGAESSEVVADLLQRHLSFEGISRPAAGKVARKAIEPTGGRVVFVARRGSVQTQVLLYIAGEPVPAARVPAMQAFDEYLGGDMAGLVFQEVREYRALAYSAHGGFVPPERMGAPGHTFVRLACQSDKTLEAIRLVAGLLTKLPRRPQRLPGLVAALTHRQETGNPHFRELQERIDAWRWQGFNRDPREAWAEVYPLLQFADVEAFWAEQVAGRPIVLMVAGDPKHVDERELSAFGPVEVVREGTLFR